MPGERPRRNEEATVNRLKKWLEDAAETEDWLLAGEFAWHAMGHSQDFAMG